MKLLILTNFVLPEIANIIGTPVSNGGGWIGSMVSLLKNEYEVIIGCYSTTISKIEGNINNIKYYIFSEKNTVTEVERIIKIESPDIIHSFGTELKRSYDMIAACQNAGMLHRTVTNIQGLSSEIAKYYFTGLPLKAILPFTLRDLIKHNNVFFARERFRKNGEFEIKSLNKLRYVIGRTEWDYACTKRINPNLRYFYCNETMRDSFYTYSWDYEKCVPHSIFVSQCGYPIKGFHYLLEALPEIKRAYPDVTVFVVGNVPGSIMQSLRSSYYTVYIKRMIHEKQLEENIKFLGDLSEDEMRNAFLNANVFVSCSIIENSSNSIAEAMLLGMPIVASYVGGTPSMLSDSVEGLLYPVESTSLLANHVITLFSNNDMAKKLGASAKKRALVDHDRDGNFQILKNIYHSMINNDTEESVRE